MSGRVGGRVSGQVTASKSTWAHAATEAQKPNVGLAQLVHICITSLIVAARLRTGPGAATATCRTSVDALTSESPTKSTILGSVSMYLGATSRTHLQSAISSQQSAVSNQQSAISNRVLGRGFTHLFGECGGEGEGECEVREGGVEAYPQLSPHSTFLTPALASLSSLPSLSRQPLARLPLTTHHSPLTTDY